MRKKGRLLKILMQTILISMAVIFVLTAGFLSYIFTRYGEEIGQILGIVKEVKEEKIIIDKPLNILVLGLDIGDVNNRADYNIKRTDTIMLVHYDPEKALCDVVSIPRDTMFYYKNKKNKINAAYPIGGDELIENTIESMLNTNVDYIVKVDYKAFREVVDALGGVKMYIERNMNYDDPTQNLSIHFNKGDTVTLDGKKAEEFFRWRKNNDGSGFVDGDIGRIENQHKLMQKIFQKLISPSIILKIDNILGVIRTNVHTDMPFEEMVSYGTTLSAMTKDSIRMHTLKGESEYIDKLWYFIYDKDENTDIIKILNDKSLITNEPD